MSENTNLKPSCDRIFWAALGLGSLFYIFFYFWTAALLALAIAIVVDTANRKTYFLVGIFGTLIGIPRSKILLIVTGCLEVINSYLFLTSVSFRSPL